MVGLAEATVTNTSMVLPGGNIDCKGVARGKCTECQLCDQFLIKDEDVKCSYCGHPPTSHMNLEQGKEFEVELSESTPFPDHLTAEPAPLSSRESGAINVRARLFSGYADAAKVQRTTLAVFFCVTITLMCLVLITFGLIVLILLPIVLVIIIGVLICTVCRDPNPNNITLTFDNDKQTMTGPTYGTIPYSQISFSTYFLNPATVFFEVRVRNVQYVDERNCMKKRFTLEIGEDDPKYIIKPLNNNAIQLKEVVESLAAFTGIPYQPPAVAWDTMQILINTDLARRAAIRRRRHHRH